MNEILKIIRNLKAGKNVIIADRDKRYAMMGMLETFGVKVIQDGTFIKLAVLEEKKA